MTVDIYSSNDDDNPVLLRFIDNQLMRAEIKMLHRKADLTFDSYYIVFIVKINLCII